MDFREGEGGGKKSNLAFVAEYYHFTPLSLSAPHPGSFTLCAPAMMCVSEGMCTLRVCPHLLPCGCVWGCVCVCVCVCICALRVKSQSRGNGCGLTGGPIVGLIKHFRFNTPSLSLTQTLPHHSSPPHFSWRIERGERDGAGWGGRGPVTMGGDLVVARSEGTRDDGGG